MSGSPPSFDLVKSESHRARLIAMRSAVERILGNRLHGHFTDHSVTHSDRVADLAAQLAEPLPADKKLTVDEAFVLFAAAYLHDIGMHNEHTDRYRDLGTKLQSKGTPWHSLPSEQKLLVIRDHHHQISADMIVESVRHGMPSIGYTLNDDDCPGEIAVICEAHCVDTNSPLYEDLMKGARHTMRLRLLSALLRLSDVLDEASHRAHRIQARTLNLNIESQRHWWRHYYTREIGVEPLHNRITVRFQFPAKESDEYVQIVPPLQMPWIEKELSRHRKILAENGLSWHIGSEVIQTRSILETMPDDVKGAMLQELARLKFTAAEDSRLAVLARFDPARKNILGQWDALNQVKDSKTADEYLAAALAFARDLTKLESYKTAWNRLSSAIHYSTSNGRNASTELAVDAVTELGTMFAADELPSNAIHHMFGMLPKAKTLPDHSTAKLKFFERLATICFRSGYYFKGVEISKEAMRLLPAGEARDILSAELAEAQLLFNAPKQATEEAP